jgi:hypothetical protein
VTTHEQHHGADFASVAHARMDALEARRELEGVLTELAAKADIKARLGRQLRTHKREVAITTGLVATGVAALLFWRFVKR